jgi:hypothetical protein
MPAWTSAPTTGYQSLSTFQYAKVLPKYCKGTIEKVEFDLKPEKLSAQDIQRM